MIAVFHPAPAGKQTIEPTNPLFYKQKDPSADSFFALLLSSLTFLFLLIHCPLLLFPRVSLTLKKPIKKGLPGNESPKGL